MKGLLLKDIYELIKQFKFFLMFCILYIFLSFTQGGYFFLGFSIVYFALLPTSIMALDERSKWESYAITMPYTRKEMVLSKYILSILGVAFMSMLYIIINVIMHILNVDIVNGIWDSIKIVASFSLLAILISAINLPINFKFGSEKGRIGTIFIFVIVGAIAGGVLSESIFANIVINYILSFSVSIYFIIMCILFFISFYISTKIYEKKDI